MLFLLFLFVLQSRSLNIVLSFDDALVEHHQVATDLSTLNTKGVFYINSGRIGTPNYLTLSQLQSIYALGHEIGGHTLTHANLSSLSYVDQFNEICNDRDQLLLWGFNSSSFAFPFGNNDENTFNIIGQCGYNSARDSGGIRTLTSCLSCPKSESQIPSNLLQLRSVSYRTSMGVSQLQWFVTEANNDPLYTSGTLIFVFHEYGTKYVGSTVTSYITPNQLGEFVNWLYLQNGITITTLDNIINKRVYPNFANLSSNLFSNQLNIAFSFDFGTSDHLNVSTTLEQFDMRGTFFVSSSNIGVPGYLNKQSLKKLEQRGHEIAGTTLSQVRLSQLSLSDQTYQIKTNRDFLVSLGFNVSSFMWPYGDDVSTLYDVLKSLKYDRARDIGGIKSPNSCLSCPVSIGLPQTQPYLMRAINVNSSVKTGQLFWHIWQAENWALTNPSKNSLLVFKFETVCDQCQFSPQSFLQFIRWLYPRQKIGTINQLIKNL